MTLPLVTLNYPCNVKEKSRARMYSDHNESEIVNTERRVRYTRLQLSSRPDGIKAPGSINLHNSS